jgi:hypothetical protein
MGEIPHVGDQDLLGRVEEAFRGEIVSDVGCGSSGLRDGITINRWSIGGWWREESGSHHCLVDSWNCGQAHTRKHRGFKIKSVRNR